MMETNLEESTSMEDVKHYIQTELLHPINEGVVLQVNDLKFDIFIKELENPVRPIPCYFCEYQGAASHGVFKLPTMADTKQGHHNLSHSHNLQR